MAAYIVTYDLMKQGQNYNCIIAKLKAYSTHWQMQQSAWIIVSSQTAIEIRNDLLNCLDANDKLFKVVLPLALRGRPLLAPFDRNSKHD